MKVLQIDANVLHTYRNYIAGKPLGGTNEAVTSQVESVIEGQSYSFRKYESDVLCSPINGNGVLVIEMEKGERVSFLFDGPIIVKKDTWFCAAAYNCDLQYKITGIKIEEKEEKKSDFMVGGMVPQVFVTSIFSVLYQTRHRNDDGRTFKHFYWELTYVDYGQLICEVDGRRYNLEKGDLMFFTPFQSHKLLNGSPNPVAFLTITFDVNNQRFVDLKNKVVRSDSMVRRLAKDMLTEYNQDMLFFNEMIASQLLSLMIHVLRVETNCVPNGMIQKDVEISDNEIVKKCIQIIEENLPHKISAEAMADELYVSATKVRRIFKQEIGVSVSDYVKNRKLDMAKVMISEGSYSITQISDMLEYCSVCYFSSEFKKKFGIQPKEYEKSIMKLTH